jgi:hypothetical protein
LNAAALARNLVIEARFQGGLSVSILAIGDAPELLKGQAIGDFWRH